MGKNEVEEGDRFGWDLGGEWHGLGFWARLGALDQRKAGRIQRIGFFRAIHTERRRKGLSETLRERIG
jgi:hypothetical protein